MKRKNNRLTDINYHRHNAYYLTLCSNNKRTFFSKPNVIKVCLKNLLKVAIKLDSKLWVYCFMPDHLHLLLETDNCSKTIKLFKQLSGYEFKQNTGKQLWQKSYYDHIIRDSENFQEVIKYILNNPVRAGLVKHYLDHPYSGSFEFNIKEFVEG